MLAATWKMSKLTGYISTFGEFEQNKIAYTPVMFLLQYLKNMHATAVTISLAHSIVYVLIRMHVLTIALGCTVPPTHGLTVHSKLVSNVDVKMIANHSHVASS